MSGGTYAYGRRQLGAAWGSIAGWAFIVGKLASCAAIALAFGRYAAPGAERPAAVAAVVVLTAVNYRGIRKTAGVTWLLVVPVLAVLVVLVTAVGATGHADAGRLAPLWPPGGGVAVLRSAGLLFFAFAGYARLATLGEEVVDPARTIPRSVTLTVTIALIVYGAVAAAALLVVGAPTLPAARAPLEVAAEATRLSVLPAAVRVAAGLATLGVLLALLAAVSRTVFAMAADAVLPPVLASVHPVHRVPHRAEITVGLLVAVLVAFVPLAGAIGVSAFMVLLYYAITNAAALTLRPEQRRWPVWLSWIGLVGCLVLAFTLPPVAVGVGAAALMAWGLLNWFRRR